MWKLQLWSSIDLPTIRKHIQLLHNIAHIDSKILKQRAQNTLIQIFESIREKKVKEREKERPATEELYAHLGSMH